MKSWRLTFLLVSGLGISQLGNWIYFVAINLAILDLTGSAAAIAGLFMIRPMALLLTNFWSGSIVDRVDVRKLMMLTDIVRGALMVAIPFASSLWTIYGLVFLISLAGSFFGPSQSVYITKLIPESERARFNSILGMSGSGAFLLGPAISGLMIPHWGTDFSIFFNAVTFFVCAALIGLLPSVGKGNVSVVKGACVEEQASVDHRASVQEQASVNHRASVQEQASVNHRASVQEPTPIKEPVPTSSGILPSERRKNTWKLLAADWREVGLFARTAKPFLLIYALFQSSLLIGMAIDSQEATFIKLHLGLSEADYGILLSTTGIGSLAGTFTAALLAKRVSFRWYMGIGTLFTSLFYFLFYVAGGFWLAAIAFIGLGFSFAYAGTGYATYFQKEVPTGVMGRVASASEALQGALQIVLTLLVGLLADKLGLQAVCLTFAGLSVLFGLLLALRMAGNIRSQRDDAFST
ncbi:MFS transporter [Paenibacillus herberti]|uniref:MFS transporter n=1 Tax=Paenibacillus herberti TaxID=1619309 RepID=A0A229NWW8_9BACL|nr:MFS transporter [Paenibacillus herberti]OXM14358.1 MFS transporter [Paenibacillus herberti]